MLYRGAIEGISRVGLRGWIAPADGADRPVRVTIRAGQEEATILARLPRDDVRAAGLSASGQCGFEYVFQQPLSAGAIAAVVVTEAGSGEPLQRADGDGLSLYDRMFAGSYGADNATPEGAFLSPHYTRHNARRLEHLASLVLPLRGRTVVEFGAGVGDHTAFYLDRACAVMATDGRAENLGLLRRRLSGHPRYDSVTTAIVDVDAPFTMAERYDIVHCYGLLYHLANPVEALFHMAHVCGDLFLLETKADARGDVVATVGAESNADVYHSLNGPNVRPSRSWIAVELRKYFPYVYFPTTTPSHEEFPADWTDLSLVSDGWPRTIVVASRTPLINAALSEDPPMRLTPV